MSKATIKKLLRSMSKEQIIEMVIEMYDARKEAKDYLEYYASPDENSKLEEYKDIIREEFYPERRREPKTRFSVCRKAVADFKKLKPSADALAELMLSYMEYAIFDKTVQFIAKNGLWEKYDKRLQQCVKWSSVCGYGFADGIDDIYEEARSRYGYNQA